MNDIEKQIIIKEINKWRQGKLLPSEYCDFLLNLYLEGDRDDIPETNSAAVQAKPVGRTVKNMVKYMAISIMVALAAGCFMLLIMNYTVFTLPVQIAVLFALVLASYGYLVVYKYRGKQPIILTLLHAIASVILAIAFVSAMQLSGYGEWVGLMIAGMTAVFLVWMATALWLRHRLVFIASLGGLTVLYYKVVSFYVASQTVFHYQQYWLPLFLIALWLAFGCNLKAERRQYGLIFLFVGVIYFFMPEVEYYVQNVSFQSFQYTVPVKLLILAIVGKFGYDYMKHSENKQLEV